MTAPRYAPAFRPGRVTCWYVVNTTTAETIERTNDPDKAKRSAGLLNALSDELDAIRRPAADIDDRPGADFRQCHDPAHAFGCPCGAGGDPVPA